MSKKENIQTSHIISYGSINDAGDPWIDVEDKKPFEFKTFLKSYASSYIPSIVSWYVSSSIVYPFMTSCLGFLHIGNRLSLETSLLDSQ